MARLFFSYVWHVLLLLFASVDLILLADEIEQEIGWPAAPAHLYQPEGTEQRLLDRFERYLNREQWDDAFESAARLLRENRSTVVAVGEHRYVSTNEYVHQQLANLPLEVLAKYRDLVDAPAEAWTRQGMAEHDLGRLQRVVDELFCSRWGDEALFALGELALERGDHQTARRHWCRISSELQLFGEPSVLAYPDTDLSLADVRTRLALVSIFEGDLDRAKKEIKTLSAIHGKAVGRLGGQKVVLAEALVQMLQQAESWKTRPRKDDWPTFGGSTARTNARPFTRKKPYKKLWSRSILSESTAGPCTFPVVFGKLLLYQSELQVEALHLDTGERAFVSEGVGFQSSATQATTSLKELCSTLSGTDRRAFGTTSASLWGINLRRDGALIFQQRPEAAAPVGAPVVVGDRLWVALQSGGPRARAGIACYDLATTKKIWNRWICRASTPAPGRANELVPNLLTYDSGVVYSCTHLGAVAACRAEDGYPLWITTYERTYGPTPLTEDRSYCRAPNLCVFSRGVLFVSPTDSRNLLAIDAMTGMVRWRYKRVSPFGQILGAADGSLLVSDHGFRTFDLLTGEPKIHQKELRLRGHPVIVGEVIYWPTEQTIQVVKITTGNSSEETLQLPESGGANLLVADGYLIAAGPSQLTVYQSPSPLDESPQTPQIP